MAILWPGLQNLYDFHPHSIPEVSDEVPIRMSGVLGKVVFLVYEGKAAGSEHMQCYFFHSVHSSDPSLVLPFSVTCQVSSEVSASALRQLKAITSDADGSQKLIPTFSTTIQNKCHGKMPAFGGISLVF